MSDFKLSASLEGHTEDVRAVAFPSPTLALTASRDGRVNIWEKSADKTPPEFESRVSSSATSFVNAVAFVPPSTAWPDGLVLSGGKDGIIDVRSTAKTSVDNADTLWIGHGGNVCALTVSQSGSHVISGSWDSTARVWSVDKLEQPAVVLEGHGGSVWAVTTILDDQQRELIVTGCADKLIRIFNFDGKQLATLAGSTDVVRALCRLPAGSEFGGHFASAGNDDVIRIWMLGLTQPIKELYGHGGFIYSLDVLPTGELVSSSEDRTVRVWKGSEPIQTITHPAVSVWAVAICRESGDMISGTSDHQARIFTRESDQAASEEATSAFNSSVQAFEATQQAASKSSQIDKNSLPGKEFIQTKSGLKDGQVQMIREDDDSVSAYQWSVSDRKWDLVGTIVGAAGPSSNKKPFEGKEYDFVFDVDIEDGKPPLRLPYNQGENPHDAARRFLERNNLPMTYYEATAKFIIDNTKNAPSRTQSEQASGSTDGTGGAGVPAKVSKPSLTLPLTEYLVITEVKLGPIQGRLLKLNQSLESPAKLSDSEIKTLMSTFIALEKVLESPTSGKKVSGESIELFLKMAATWPVEHKFPVFDIIRLLAACCPEAAGPVDLGELGQKESLLAFMIDSDSAGNVFNSGSPTAAVLMGLRTVGNLFNTTTGRQTVLPLFDRVVECVKDLVTDSSPITADSGRSQLLAYNRDIALATVFLNYSVLFTKTEKADADSTSAQPVSGSDPSAANRTMTMVSLLVDLVKRLTQSRRPTDQPKDDKGTKDMDEALFRALAALGTVLLGSEPVFIELAYDAFNFQALVEDVTETGKSHPRIEGLLAEMKAGLDKIIKDV